MGFTTNYQIPYPELTDIPDGAGQMKALASQVDTKVKPIDDRVTANEGAIATNAAAIATNATNITSNTNRIAALEAGPFARAKRTAANTAVASGVNIQIAYDFRYEDATGMFNAAGDVITVPKAGVYLVEGVVAWAVNGTGIRFITVNMNPPYPNAETPQWQLPPISTAEFRYGFSWMQRLSAGNTINVVTAHTASTSIALSASYNCTLSVLWLRG